MLRNTIVAVAVMDSNENQQVVCATPNKRACQKSLMKYLQVPADAMDNDEDSSLCSTPTPTDTSTELAARKAAAISGRRKKKKTASCTSLASNTFKACFLTILGSNYNFQCRKFIALRGRFLAKVLAPRCRRA